MALKAFVESIDSIDESLRGEYDEVEGGFRLSVEEVKGYALENVEGLRSALGKERTAVKDLTKKVSRFEKEFEGIDLDDLKGAKTSLAEIQEKYEQLAAIDPAKESDKLADEKVKDKLARKQAEWKKQFDVEVGTRDDKLKSLNSQLHELMVNSQAVKVLAENGAAESVDLLLPHVLKNVRLSTEGGKAVVEVVDSEGNPRVRSDGRNMELVDLVPELKTKWPNAFTADVRSGSGIRPDGQARRVVQTPVMSANEKIVTGLSKLA